MFYNTTMRYSEIPRDLFRRNRNKLKARLDKGSLAIVHANDQMLRNGDQFYPYRFQLHMVKRSQWLKEKQLQILLSIQAEIVSFSSPLSDGIKFS